MIAQLGRCAQSRSGRWREPRRELIVTPRIALNAAEYDGVFRDWLADAHRSSDPVEMDCGAPGNSPGTKGNVMRIRSPWLWLHHAAWLVLAFLILSLIVGSLWL